MCKTCLMNTDFNVAPSDSGTIARSSSPIEYNAYSLTYLLQEGLLNVLGKTQKNINS